jgi:hypothetical protein
LAFHSGREADHSPPSNAEVKEWVELYLHSPNTPSWEHTFLNRVRTKHSDAVLNISALTSSRRKKVKTRKKITTQRGTQRNVKGTCHNREEKQELKEIRRKRNCKRQGEMKE